jgi:hypothetical protein
MIESALPVRDSELEPEGPTFITGTARFVPATVYIAITLLSGHTADQSLASTGDCDARASTRSCRWSNRGQRVENMAKVN